MEKGESFRSSLDALGIGVKVYFLELDPEGFDQYVFPEYGFRLCKGFL